GGAARPVDAARRRRRRLRPPGDADVGARPDDPLPASHGGPRRGRGGQRRGRAPQRPPPPPAPPEGKPEHAGPHPTTHPRPDPTPGRDGAPATLGERVRSLRLQAGGDARPRGSWLAWCVAGIGLALAGLFAYYAYRVAPTKAGDDQKNAASAAGDGNVVL